MAIYIYDWLMLPTTADRSGSEVIALLGIAGLLAIVGIVCFSITVWSSRSKPFSVNRTNLTLSGDSRTEISKPLVFAIGAVLSLGLAAGLIAYRPGPKPDSSQTNGKK